LKDAQGHDTAEAAYYLGTNRNKRSVTCDIGKSLNKTTLQQSLHPHICVTLAASVLHRLNCML
jgi:hypothetical protein